MNRQRIISALLVVVNLVNAQTATKTSCKELMAAGQTLDGLYWINTNIGVIQVYCDMTTDNGGWTYLPKSVLAEDGLNLNNIFKDKNSILLHIKNKYQVQTYTKLEPLAVTINNTEVKFPFDVKINCYSSYTKPINSPKLGSYMLLGILPKSAAKNINNQGFISNEIPVTFKNCNGDNSLFAFFPNFHNRNSDKYHDTNLIYERTGLAVNWRKTGKVSLQQLPNNYFFQTEAHFGGCGTYTFSDRWVEADGTAIGMR